LPQPIPSGHRTLHLQAREPLPAALYEREALHPGHCLAGPAIVQEALCTTLVGPGQQLTVGEYGELYIERQTGGTV
jgi:N-methylhydantoinase A